VQIVNCRFAHDNFAPERQQPGGELSLVINLE